MLGELLTRAYLILLRRDHQEWDIGLTETGVWLAITNPTPTSEHVIAAYSLDELGMRLDDLALKQGKIK